MRCCGVGVASGANVADHVASVQEYSSFDFRRIAVQMCVVIREFFSGIKVVNSQAARFAVEQLGYLSVRHREYLSSPRRQDVDRFMATRASTSFIERGAAEGVPEVSGASGTPLRFGGVAPAAGALGDAPVTSPGKGNFSAAL